MSIPMWSVGPSVRNVVTKNRSGSTVVVVGTAVTAVEQHTVTSTGGTIGEPVEISREYTRVRLSGSDSILLDIPFLEFIEKWMPNKDA